MRVAVEGLSLGWETSGVCGVDCCLMGSCKSNTWGEVGAEEEIDDGWVAG